MQRRYLNYKIPFALFISLERYIKKDCDFWEKYEYKKSQFFGRIDIFIDNNIFFRNSSITNIFSAASRRQIDLNEIIDINIMIIWNLRQFMPNWFDKGNIFQGVISGSIRWSRWCLKSREEARQGISLVITDTPMHLVR